MTKQVTVTGTDCFALAAQEFGDATQAYRIMEQNGLTDFVISGEPVTITIPDPATTTTDGVPTQ